MLSRRILTVIGLILAVSVYLLFIESKPQFIYPLGASIFLGMIIYIFHHQIDWWWTRRTKPKLSAQMRAMVYQTNHFVHQLSPEDREKFEERMVQWVAAKDFIGKGIDDFPEDLKYITAIYPVLLTIFREEYLFEDLDRVAFYPHAFLSPGYPDDIHSCELETEDGVFIFSTEQLMVGHMQPKRYYNVLLHTFAEAYQYKFGDVIKIDDQMIWKKLEQISQISKEKIDAFIGIVQTDPWPMTIHHYFTYPEHFKSILPEYHERLTNWHFNR